MSAMAKEERPLQPRMWIPASKKRVGVLKGQWEEWKENLGLPHGGALLVAVLPCFPTFPFYDWILPSFSGPLQRTKACMRRTRRPMIETQQWNTEKEGKALNVIRCIPQAALRLSAAPNQGRPPPTGEAEGFDLEDVICKCSIWNLPPSSMLNLAAVLKLYAS